MMEEKKQRQVHCNCNVAQRSDGVVWASVSARVLWWWHVSSCPGLHLAAVG